MELKQITELMKAPEKLIDPRQINVMVGYISGFITDGEEELNERNYQVSAKWAEIRKKVKYNTEADRAIELTEEYKERERVKRLIGQLRRFRGDLNNRFEVLTRYNR